MLVSFRKYHGLGNDFVVLDGITRSLPVDRLTDVEVASRLCDRHRGIGADGLLLVLPPRGDGSQARMRVINADGSEPEMCGNGIRCVAKALRDHILDLSELDVLTIDTGAGPLECQLSFGEDGLVSSVRVDMGKPSLDPETLPMRSDGPFVDQPISDISAKLRWTGVSMGNPHIVAFVDDPNEDLRALAEELGPGMERHELFPNRTNVELVRLVNDGGAGRAETWVWERGCGITQACGTGACAVAVAAAATERFPAGDDLAVALPGGTLRIQVAEDRSRVLMDGPAVEVFSGALEL
jgi:diaminopimelate epimerase